MRRHARPPYLDYGTSRDLEIQPVPNMSKHNITLDHFDCGISRDQSCEWGTKWDLCAPGLSCCFASERTLRSRWPPSPQPPILRDGRGRSGRGPSIRSDRVFRPHDRSCRPSAFARSDPMQTAADSEHGRAIRSTDESRSPPILRQHFHIFGEFVVSFTFTHIRTF